MTEPAAIEVVADDRRRRRLLWLLLPVGAVVAYLIWTTASGVLAGSDEQGSGAASSGRTLSGTVGSSASGSDQSLSLRVPDIGGLAPGVTRTVLVTVVNDDRGPVRLQRVDGTVTGPQLPAGCAAGDLSVQGWTAPATAPVLARGGTLAVPVQVSMLETGVNQDACKGAPFSLSFTATGTAGS